ncbi:hypothetical protein H9P43_000166 [Blastocladiella emersonii ATCC 22665]|nr:hypothetical protein H9P43_000166 [Blastocladiella emersonii ATCC 22665]
MKRLRLALHQLTLLALQALVFALAVRAAWPDNVRITAAERSPAFVHPTTLYLPRERKIYVFGGRQLPSGRPVDLADVAVIDLGSPIANLSDPMSPAVAPAPFRLPAADSYMPSFTFTGSSGGYEVHLFGGLSPETAPFKHYRVPDLLRATGVENVTQPITANTSLRVINPGWAATSTPLEAAGGLASDPAAYVFGNWSDVTSGLWRFDKAGLTEIQPSSGDRPQARGWASLTRFDANRLVLVGGNDGTNKQLADIWLFSILPRTWSRYSSSFTVKRDDFQSAVYTSPDSTRYLLVFGYAAPVLEYVALDKGTPPVTATIDPPLPAAFGSLAANSLVVHDSHLFILGGSPVHFMSALKITPNGDELKFAWVSSYTPSYKPPEGNATSPSPVPTATGNPAPVATIIGASVGGVIVLAGLVAGIVLFRRRAKDHRQDRAQRDLLLHTLIEDHRATSRSVPTWPSMDGSTLGPRTPTTPGINQGANEVNLPGGVRVVHDRDEGELLYLPTQTK